MSADLQHIIDRVAEEMAARGIPGMVGNDGTLDAPVLTFTANDGRQAASKVGFLLGTRTVNHVVATCAGEFLKSLPELELET